MWLRQVVVENFRAFQHARFALPEHGLVLVAGANNAGKSALLSALDVIAGIEAGSAFRHAAASGPAILTATFELDDRARAGLLHRLAGRDELLAAGALKSVELVMEERRGRSPKVVEVRGDWPSRGMSTLGIASWDSVQNQGAIQVARVVGPDDSPRTRDDTPTTGVGSSDLELVHRVSGGVSSLEDYMTGLAELQPLWNSLQEWRQRYYHFRALRPGTQRQADLASEELLQPTGENLPAVLLGLLTNRSHIFAELRRIIAEIVPSAGKLETPTEGTRMEVSFADPYRPGFRLNLKDLGTGVEQLLLTIVVGLTQRPPFVLVLEEPETNLHPAAQRALLGLLETLGT